MLLSGWAGKLVDEHHNLRIVRTSIIAVKFSACIMYAGTLVLLYRPPPASSSSNLWTTPLASGMFVLVVLGGLRSQPCRSHDFCRRRTGLGYDHRGEFHGSPHGTEHIYAAHRSFVQAPRAVVCLPTHDRCIVPLCGNLSLRSRGRLLGVRIDL